METFCAYMDRMLYGPTGYYASGTARSGRRGDYFTAPDVGPVFGRLLAAIFRDWENQMALPRFSVVEAGPGEGRLAGDILNARAFDYTAVERSPSRLAVLKTLAASHPTLRVSPDLGALAKAPVQGVLFGNELIDAFPVHRVRRQRGRLEELYVGAGPCAAPPDIPGPGPARGNALTFQWGPLSTPLLQDYFARLGITLPEGYETEVNLAMRDWTRQAAAALASGLVVLIDYGRPAHEYYAPERANGTLRVFSKHRVGEDFKGLSGLADLTADVDFTSLALDARAFGLVPLAFMSMRTFLMMGAQALAAEAGPAQTAPRGLTYLLHPDGMGAAFEVLILGKNVDPAKWPFPHNRIGRLGMPA